MLYGGIIIVVGYFIFVVFVVWFFYLGLILIVIGMGLLKLNISMMVGEFYEGDDGLRCDVVFFIFYMGINFGGFFGLLFCGYFC